MSEPRKTLARGKKKAVAKPSKKISVLEAVAHAAISAGFVPGFMSLSWKHKLALAAVHIVKNSAVREHIKSALDGFFRGAVLGEDPNGELALASLENIKARMSPAELTSFNTVRMAVGQMLLGGSQSATFWSRVGVVKYLTDASGNYATVANINPTNIIDIASLGAIFDEQQVLKGRVTFVPSGYGYGGAINAACGVNGAVIDYVDITAIASDNAALAYDTFKHFHVSTTAGGATKWKVVFIGQPDEAWIKTGTNVNMAFWKPWTFTNLPNSANTYYGAIEIELESRYRQVS